MYSIMSSENSEILASSFPISFLFTSFSSVIAIARTSNILSIEDEMVGCITNLIDMSLSKLWEVVMDGGGAGREGHGNPLQYSYLENPMDGGAWWLQSMESLRVGHNWVTSLSLLTFMHWRRKWRPTPVFLPGESQGQGSLVGCHLWGHTESDTTEETQQ